MSELQQNESPWKSVYVFGGIAAVLSLIAVVVDMVIGSSTGGNLSRLPQTAVERFSQFQQNAWLSLYNLDLLNAVDELISIPVYFALYDALRKTNKPDALLADNEIHNLVRKLSWDIHQNYRTGIDVCRLPPHISLKQPFDISDLDALSEYMTELAQGLEPGDRRASLQRSP